MKTLLIVVCVCVLSVGMTGGMAQEKRKETTEPLIEKKYDRFKDETTIKLKPQKLREIAKPREELRLSVEATHKGERAMRPKEVVWVFDSVSESYVYRDEAEVIFIVDGKRINAGTAYEIEGFPSPNLIKTTLKLTASLDSFLSIAGGKVIEMRLANNKLTRLPTVEIQLSEKVASSLREFANAITRESKGG